jgi:predicted dehydrogenase
VIRVAIIGCGKVADSHAAVIARIPEARLVGVCDREELMARQMAERFGVEHACTQVSELLERCLPRVVHITTPPQSHFAIARECLRSGTSVYVEKPFTLDLEEAKELIALATALKQKITVGHNTQFTPVAREMRLLIHEGYLGGPPVHMESIYCYNLADERYAKALLGDKEHWVRALPGGLLHNIINHGIGKIAEFMTGEAPTVLAHGFLSQYLEKIGESGIVDELRSIICDERRTTAYFTFSSQMSPALHQFRIYGRKNSLIVDHNHQTLLRLPGKSYKSYLNQFIPPALEGKQCLGNACSNLRKFLARHFHADSGLHYLTALFYRSVVMDEPLPIPYRDILLTCQIMDKIFSQLPPVGRADSLTS